MVATMQIGPSMCWRLLTAAVTPQRAAIPVLFRIPVVLVNILLTLCATAAVAHAASASPAEHRPLRVATTEQAPFVFPNTTPLSGFSIDLWNEVARRLRVDFSWTVVPTHADLLRAVQRGDADLAIAAITITSEREKLVDFSYPYFDSGLQIMVRAENESSFMDTLQAVPWSTVGKLFGAATIIMFLLASVLWFVERRSNPNFTKGFGQGVIEGLWGTMSIIMVTGEYAERNALGIVKRLTIVGIWLLGVVLTAQFTATVTSSQTVQRLRSSVQGPGDLPGKTIATVPGTVAADYLTQIGLPYASVTNPADAFKMLMGGQAQAIVFDAPTLRYWAARRGDRVLQVVGPVFRPEKYGIAVPDGSVLRKRINEALLAMSEDGTYEHIYAKWFSGEK